MQKFETNDIPIDWESGEILYSCHPTIPSELTIARGASSEAIQLFCGFSGLLRSARKDELRQFSLSIEIPSGGKFLISKFSYFS